jgi:hypothetical protein
VSGKAVEAILGRLEFWEHRILAAAAIALTVGAIYLLVRRHLQRRMLKH